MRRRQRKQQKMEIIITSAATGWHTRTNPRPMARGSRTGPSRPTAWPSSKQHQPRKTKQRKTRWGLTKRRLPLGEPHQATSHRIRQRCRSSTGLDRRRCRCHRSFPPATSRREVSPNSAFASLRVSFPRGHSSARHRQPTRSWPEQSSMRQPRPCRCDSRRHAAFHAVPPSGHQHDLVC